MAVEVARQTIVFEDIFEITDKDPDGKKFDKGTCQGWVEFIMSVFHVLVTILLSCAVTWLLVQSPESKARATFMKWTCFWTSM